jgi:translation initiation factor 1
MAAVTTSKKGLDALAVLKDALPPGPPPAAPAPARGPDPFAGKIVVAKTKKGRGGKTVTAIDGVALRGDALAALARELAKALGCGASVEGDRIVVQGEQQERVRALLEARGARRVVIGA